MKSMKYGLPLFTSIKIDLAEIHKMIETSKSHKKH